MLEISGLSSGYGGLPVLQGIGLAVAPREIVALVGANGAGKSTLAKTLSGIVAAMSGEIRLDGERIDRLSSRARIGRGIAHVPEGRQVFAGMTVAENLRLGAFVLRGAGASAVIETRLREVCALFPVLGDRARSPAGHLSGGQQQMLAIARGLMSGPRLLILDEPSLGLSPLIVAEIFGLMRRLRDQGVAILVAEQNARAALGIADRGYVLENGRVALTGSAQYLLQAPEVAERYLGVGAAAAYSEDESIRIAQRLHDKVWADDAILR
jgi:branched-chain amino acid transport system ATP-binding protein